MPALRLAIPLLLPFCCPPAQAQAPAMPAYMGCARALAVTINDKFAILPGERLGLNGLYIYTNGGAFFLALGAPDARDREAQDFYVRTNVSSVGELYLTYRQARPGTRANVQPGISYETVAPVTKSRGPYRLTPAIDASDSGAREVLSRTLQQKVGTIKALIDDKNSFSTPAEAKLAFEKDRVNYLARLERCRIEGDRPLNLAVEDEVQKLKFGFPGITVWEKQVGTRPR